jgi:hypothetical protein
VGVKIAGIRWSTATTAAHQVAALDSQQLPDAPPRAQQLACPGVSINPQFREKNRRGIGKSQSKWTAYACARSSLAVSLEVLPRAPRRAVEPAHQRVLLGRRERAGREAAAAWRDDSHRNGQTDRQPLRLNANVTGAARPDGQSQGRRREPRERPRSSQPASQPAMPARARNGERGVGSKSQSNRGEACAPVVSSSCSSAWPGLPPAATPSLASPHGSSSSALRSTWRGGGAPGFWQVWGCFRVGGFYPPLCVHLPKHGARTKISARETNLQIRAAEDHEVLHAVRSRCQCHAVGVQATGRRQLRVRGEITGPGKYETYR